MIRLRRIIGTLLAVGVDRVQALHHQIMRYLIFAAIAVGGGLGATWLLVERGSALTTERQGPWIAWTAAGRSDADPYTRAHFVRRAVLPANSAIVQRFEATADDEGRALHSSCEYLVEGPEPPAYWSLAVFDRRGRSVRNDAERYGFNSDTALVSRAGTIAVHLSRNARPGNWLPTGGAGHLVLVMQVETALAGLPAGSETATTALPQIRRLRC